jgi:hypothetical protein
LVATHERVSLYAPFLLYANYDFCRFACSIAAIAQASGAPLYLPLAQCFRISSIDMRPRSYLIRSHIKLVAALT